MKKILILVSIFIAINANTSFSTDVWKKCADKAINSGDFRTPGPDMYNTIIKKCGYEKFTKENCDLLYNNTYKICREMKNDYFSERDISNFILFKNFDDKELGKSCLAKKTLNREEFGKAFCEGK